MYRDEWYHGPWGAAWAGQQSLDQALLYEQSASQWAPEPQNNSGMFANGVYGPWSTCYHVVAIFKIKIVVLATVIMQTLRILG